MKFLFWRRHLCVHNRCSFHSCVCSTPRTAANRQHMAWRYGHVWWRIARHSCRPSELIRKKVAWMAIKGIHKSQMLLVPLVISKTPIVWPSHPKSFTSSRQPVLRPSIIIIASLECFLSNRTVFAFAPCRVSRLSRGRGRTGTSFRIIKSSGNSEPLQSALPVSNALMSVNKSICIMWTPQRLYWHYVFQLKTNIYTYIQPRACMSQNAQGMHATSTCAAHHSIYNATKMRQ